MPEIKRFGSFKLLMFFQDENPPHVHVKGADCEDSHLERRSACGDAPGKALRQARRWVEKNRAELSAMWDEFQR